ncbi:MAG: ComEC/Rec2 family competence protein [Anaerolineales bacterium]
MKLFWLGMIWLAGIIVGKASGLAAWIYLLGAGLGLASWLLAQDWLRRIGPGILIFSLGAFRFALAVPVFDETELAFYNGSLRPVVLTGIVSDFPDVRDRYIGLRVAAESVQYSSTNGPLPVSGAALVQASRFGAYSYGDRVQATGYLETPKETEEFSYRDYLARQGIHSLMEQAAVVRVAERQASPVLQIVFDLRQRAFETVHALFPDPEASLLAGILLGIESGIDSEVREAFNVTGTTHIIAISGFNLTVLAGLVISLFGRWFGMRRGAVAAAIAILVYTLLVGADAAVVRAAIMGGLALLARYLGRQAHALASLSAAAVAMSLLNPQVLWDVGFQLSFAATLGLVLYADPIKRGFVRLASHWVQPERAAAWAGPVGDYLLFTLAAQLTTLPLTALHFRRLSLVALVANPIILPAQPLLMMLGGLAVLAGLIWQPIGQLLAFVAWPFAAYTVRAVSLLASIPGAALELDPVALPMVVALYAAIFGVTAWAALPSERRPVLPKPSTAASIIALAIVTGLTWRGASDRPDGLLHITVFESGGSLIESPSGRYLLLNGGNSPTELAHELGRRLPLFRREIDWLVVYEAGDAQVRGLVSLTERVRIRDGLLPDLTANPGLERLMADLAEAGVPRFSAAGGQALDLGNGIRLEVVQATKRALLLRLIHGNFTVVFVPAEDAALESPWLHSGPLTAWILGDDSSLNSLPLAGSPIVILPGHRPVEPLAEPVQLLAGSVLGWIELATDGNRLWAWSERQAAR